MQAQADDRPMWRRIFAVETEALDPVKAVIATAVLLALVTARFFFGGTVIAAAAGALIVLLAGRRIANRWLVLAMAVGCGAVVTVTGQRFATSDLAALLFVWIVTFLAGLTVPLPRLNALAALINIWAIVSVKNGSGDTRRAAEAGLAWVAGSLVAFFFLWYQERRGPDEGVPDPLAVLKGISQRVRKSVVTFAFVRATGVAMAGGLGLIFFEKHPWWIAMATLMVAGVDMEASRVVAAQRAAGTLLGMSFGFLIVSNIDGKAAGIALFVVAAFLALLFRPASPLLFIAFFTLALMAAASLTAGDVLGFGFARLTESAIGIAIGLIVLAIVRRQLDTIEPQIAARLAELRAAKMAGKPVR